jgi:hypothetical protein
MASLASVEEYFTPLGALNHLFNAVLSNDGTEMHTFVQFNGIADLYDFMSSSDSDFKTPYSPTPLDPNPTIYLSSTLVKKLLSVQLWYSIKFSDAQDDIEDLETFFSLTVDTFNSWHIAQNFRRINGNEKDDYRSAKYDMPSPVVSSTPPISSPVYVAPAPVVPSFRSNIKINIPYCPTLNQESHGVPSIASYVQQLPIMTLLTSWTPTLFPVRRKRMRLNRSNSSCTMYLQTSF